MRPQQILCTIIMLLTFSLRTEAQIELYKGENKRHIQEFADDFSREQNNRYIQSQTLAKQKGIKLEDRIGDKKIIL
jgi:predicted Holliday junction resolvase-like endonuclease